MPGRNDVCHCGSGVKYKRCCYANDAAQRARSTPASDTAAQTQRLTTTLPIGIGLPGELVDLAVVPEFSNRPAAGPSGTKGDYEVIVTLRRSDTPIAPPTNFDFDTSSHKGTSQLAIAFPAALHVDPRLNVPGAVFHINIYVRAYDGSQLVAKGFPNEAGFLSDIRLTFEAESFDDADKRFRLMINPALSAISFASDVPLVASHTVIREIGTHAVRRSVVLPFPDAPVNLQPHNQSAEARTIVNMYRDALNSADANWRFLGFSRIVEQLWKIQRANRKTGAASTIDLESIRIPTDVAELAKWVRSAFPKHYVLLDTACLEIVPVEARGLTTNEVINSFTRPIRADIAHGLLEDGALPSEKNDVEHLNRVHKWLPLLRVIARMHLNECFGIS